MFGIHNAIRAATREREADTDTGDIHVVPCAPLICIIQSLDGTIYYLNSANFQIQANGMIRSGEAMPCSLCGHCADNSIMPPSVWGHTYIMCGSSRCNLALNAARLDMLATKAITRLMFFFAIRRIRIVCVEIAEIRKCFLSNTCLPQPLIEMIIIEYLGKKTLQL